MVLLQYMAAIMKISHQYPLFSTILAVTERVDIKGGLPVFVGVLVSGSNMLEIQTLSLKW